MKIFAVVGLALAPAFAFAADPLAPSPDAELQPVVVTSTRTPVAETDTLAQTIVIDRAQIERIQAIDVAQILQQYAGLDVGRSGGPGQPASLFTRGGNSDYTVVLIDGVRVNDGAFGSSPLSYISPSIIERIEVVEGPLSTLYGSDAISGVVNIITRKPGPAQLDAEVGGGSFNTVEGGVALRDQGNLDGHLWGVALATQQMHSGGIPTYAGADKDSAYRNRTINGSASLELGGVKLEARAWNTNGQSPFLAAQSDCEFNPAAGYTACDQKFRNQILALHASSQLTRNWFSELTLSRNEDRLDSEGTGLLRTIRPEADWHNVLALGDYNRLSFGALARRERVDVPGSINDSEDSDYGYVQDEVNYGRNHAVVAVNYLHSGAFGERFNWNTQYGFDVLDGTRLIATVGTAFHTPTSEDRFSPFGGNPNLQPEKAQDYELAVKQRISSYQNAEVRLFRTDVRDSIVSLPPNYIPANISHVRMSGVQADWNYTDENWTAHIDGIAQNPRNLDTDSVLIRRARLSLGAQLNRHIGRYDVGSAFYTAGRRQDSGALDGAPVTDGGYGLLDLTAGVRLTRELRFDLRGANILNHHYQTAAGYNQTGSAVYATLRYSLPL